MDARALKAKPTALGAALDERGRRLAFAAEARVLGWGGIGRARRASGMARNTIACGIRELEARDDVRPPRVRRRRL